MTNELYFMTERSKIARYGKADGLLMPSYTQDAFYRVVCSYRMADGSTGNVSYASTFTPDVNTARKVADQVRKGKWEYMDPEREGKAVDRIVEIVEYRPMILTNVVD